MISRRVFRSMILSLILLSVITLYVSIENLNTLNARHTFTLDDNKPGVFAKQYSSQNEIQPIDNNKNCSSNEQQSIVYIKIMKCASTSLKDLLQRFADDRNLEVIFPINRKIYIGWPYPPKRTYILNSTQNDFYHISCDHVIYDRDFFDSIMMPGSKYITSLRQPYSQIKSLVNYFNVLNISDVPHFTNETERFLHFMFNLEYYDKVYRSPNSSRYRYCVPSYFSMTKNLMSFSLGFSKLGGFNTNIYESDLTQPSVKRHKESQDRVDVIREYVRREEMERYLFQNHARMWLADLEDEIDLILIVEWLPESLVLMKRMFCWSTKDILVKNANIGSYDFRHGGGESVDAEMESIYRSWSWVDYELYDHFNRSLWKKLNSQPASFWNEVERFKEIVLRVTEFCSQGQPIQLVVERSQWNEGFHLDSSICLSSDEYTQKLRLRRNERIKLENLPQDDVVDQDKLFC